MRLPSTPHVLVTGFGPFGSDFINPSGVIAERLGGLVLPVAADEAWELTREELARRPAVAVLALGVAGGRDRVCVEMRAFNEAAYPIPDEGGRQLAGRFGVEKSSVTLRSAFSAAALARAIRGRKVPARVSRDAGRYVCNHFYYHLLHHLGGRAVFLHLPRLPEVAAQGNGGASMPIEEAGRAATAGLRFLQHRASLTS